MPMTVKGQNRNRKQNFNMGAVSFQKPEVVIFLAWIEILGRNFVRSFRLRKCEKLEICDCHLVKLVCRQLHRRSSSLDKICYSGAYAELCADDGQRSKFRVLSVQSSQAISCRPITVLLLVELQCYRCRQVVVRSANVSPIYSQYISPKVKSHVNSPFGYTTCSNQAARHTCRRTYILPAILILFTSSSIFRQSEINRRNSTKLCQTADGKSR